MSGSARGVFSIYSLAAQQSPLYHTVMLRATMIVAIVVNDPVDVIYKLGIIRKRLAIPNRSARVRGKQRLCGGIDSSQASPTNGQ